MSEADDVISRLSAKQQNYLNSYFYLCAGKLKEQYPGGADAGGNHVYPGGSTGRQGVYPVKGKCVRGRLPGGETVYGFCHFEPIEIFGTMEILGYMSH